MLCFDVEEHCFNKPSVAESQTPTTRATQTTFNIAASKLRLTVRRRTAFCMPITTTRLPTTSSNSSFGRMFRLNMLIGARKNHLDIIEMHQSLDSVIVRSTPSRHADWRLPRQQSRSAGRVFKEHNELRSGIWRFRSRAQSV